MHLSPVRYYRSTLWIGKIHNTLRYIAIISICPISYTCSCIEIRTAPYPHKISTDGPKRYVVFCHFCTPALSHPSVCIMTGRLLTWLWGKLWIYMKSHVHFRFPVQTVNYYIEIPKLYKLERVQLSIIYWGLPTQPSRILLVIPIIDSLWHCVSSPVQSRFRPSIFHKKNSQNLPITTIKI